MLGSTDGQPSPARAQHLAGSPASLPCPSQEDSWMSQAIKPKISSWDSQVPGELVKIRRWHEVPRDACPQPADTAVMCALLQLQLSNPILALCRPSAVRPGRQRSEKGRMRVQVPVWGRGKRWQ